MNRDELDRERPVAAAPTRAPKWRPRSTESPFGQAMSEIFAGTAARMVRAHVDDARARAREILTPAELEAMAANGLDLAEGPEL